MDNQENVKSTAPTFDWRSFRFSEEFVSDPREGYYIEFSFGPTRMLIPYQMVMEVVDKMETAMEENDGRIPYAKEVASVQAAPVEAVQPNVAEQGN